MGAVTSVTLDHMLDMARSRRDRTVQWQHPEWPVIAAIDRLNYHLVTTKPATTDQILASVQLAAGLAGVVEHVVAHDLRRGGLRDLANLETPIIGAATAAVAKAGGHSSNARFHGVTDQYIGHLKQDLWTKRLSEAEADDDLIPAIGARLYKKPRKLERSAIDLYCEENALDTTNTNDRKKASLAILKKDRIRWADEQKNLDATGISIVDSTSPSGKLFPLYRYRRAGY